MCEDYSGKVVAITGFKNEDIKDNQYLMFLKYARRYNCKVHCLGMTRTKILDKVPFDYTDSSSWLQAGIYGKIINSSLKVTRDYSKVHRYDLHCKNYVCAMDMQKKYEEKWSKL